MVKFRNVDRSQFPNLVAWLAEALRHAPDEPELWQQLLQCSGVSAPMVRDAIGGRIMSPTLQILGLGGVTCASFDPSSPGFVSLDRRLADRFEQDPNNPSLRNLAKIALLAQVAAWCRFRDGKTDFAQAAADFALSQLRRPLQSVYAELFGDARLMIELKDRDIDDLIKITVAEAGGAGTRQGRLGQAGVIFVVLNRLASTRFSTSIRGVIDQRNQFEPILSAPGRSVAGLRPPSASDRAAIAPILDDILADRLPDPTNRATFFQNVRITDERGTNFAQGFAPVAVIVDHSFYDRFRANDPVSVPAWRLVRA
jgi:hypothetical protein